MTHFRNYLYEDDSSVVQFKHRHTPMLVPYDCKELGSTEDAFICTITQLFLNRVIQLPALNIFCLVFIDSILLLHLLCPLTVCLCA